MPTQSDLSKLIFPGVVFAIGLLLIFAANTTLTHTLDCQRLIWLAGIIGIVIAVPFAWLTRDMEQYVRGAFMVLLAVGFALCTISAGGFFNHRFSPRQASIVHAEVIDKTSKGAGEKSRYYLLTNRDPGLMLQVPYHRWMNTPLSSPVRLAVIPGRLGFPYIVGLADTDSGSAR